MIYAREHFSEAYPDAKQLLQLHWKEVALNQDKIKLNVDEARYNAIDALDMLYCFTGRVGGILQAYAVFFVAPHLHYMDNLYAVNDVIYIATAHRGTGRHFVAYIEKSLEDLGINVVTYHVKAAFDWSPMLERKGYKFVDKVMQKILMGA